MGYVGQQFGGSFCLWIFETLGVHFWSAQHCTMILICSHIIGFVAICTHIIKSYKIRDPMDPMVFKFQDLQRLVAPIPGVVASLLRFPQETWGSWRWSQWSFWCCRCSWASLAFGSPLKAWTGTGTCDDAVSAPREMSVHYHVINM